MESGYPFTDEDLDRLGVEAARPTGPALATDDRPETLDLRRHETAPPDDAPGGASGRRLLLGRGPGDRLPFRLFGLSASGWVVAAAVAGQRPTWVRSDLPIRLLVDEVEEVELQLLANYLGTPVEVSALRLLEPAQGIAAGRLRVVPRHPAAASG